MPVFSYHLTLSPVLSSAAVLARQPGKGEIEGLRHFESMAVMRLGAPALSPSRLQLRRLAVFAMWEDEPALERFLETHALGRRLATGWHLRLDFLRQWGRYPNLEHLAGKPAELDPEKPVVAVTLARLRLPQVFRFVHWGKPVERQVRDHPGTTLALASYRPPGTFSTFSIWKTQREMTDMVSGVRSSAAHGQHAAAMRERERKDFHHNFTTLRFRALSEHGTWDGRSGYLPDSSPSAD